MSLPLTDTPLPGEDEPRGILTAEQRQALLLRHPLLALAHDPSPLTREEAIEELADFIEEQADLLEIVVRSPDGLSIGEQLASALLRMSNAAQQIQALVRAGTSS